MADTAQGAPWQDKDGKWHQTYKSATSGGALYSTIIQDPNTPKPPITKSNVGTPYTSAGGAAPLDSMKLAEGIVKDPKTALTPETTLATQIKPVTGTEAGTNISKNSSYATMDTDKLNQTAATVDPSSIAKADSVTAKPIETYDAKTTQADVAAQDMTGVHGAPSADALISDQQINKAQIDINSIGTGINPDGSVNETGKALNDFANLDLNDVDARATTKGQLAILQADFTGPNGEPKIPIYAQGAAREISRIAAFKGMTGTAATAAMATAMMESSIQVADSDAKFYQTVSLQNLSNKQASIIQKAGVLANFEIQNADNRMVAAVQNSKAFLEMDLANLANDQQAAVINTQSRVQSILEDAKAINTQRLFTAQETNDSNQYYDTLNSSIEQFNASQLNNMNQFNTGEVNSMSKFNSELENNREQFYKGMQYNIDIANAKWRQDVTLHNSNQKFNAAAFDVKNMVDLSTEALNQLWDRSDAMLDYIWKSSESEKDRKAQLTIANISASTQKSIADQQSKDADKAGMGAIAGTILGNIAGSDAFTDWLF